MYPLYLAINLLFVVNLSFWVFLNQMLGSQAVACYLLSFTRFCFQSPNPPKELFNIGAPFLFSQIGQLTNGGHQSLRVFEADILYLEWIMQPSTRKPRVQECSPNILSVLSLEVTLIRKVIFWGAGFAFCPLIEVKTKNNNSRIFGSPEGKHCSRSRGFTGTLRMTAKTSACQCWPTMLWHVLSLKRRPQQGV